jgi:hypothetical protein
MTKKAAQILGCDLRPCVRLFERFSRSCRCVAHQFFELGERQFKRMNNANLGFKLADQWLRASRSARACQSALRPSYAWFVARE